MGKKDKLFGILMGSTGQSHQNEDFKARKCCIIVASL
jgi:hypothetical protein